MTVKHLFPAVEPSLNLDFANSKKLDPRITFTRSSTGTYVDSNGLIKTAAANEARFDHDPVSGSSLGLLVEESRTNLAENSEDFSLWTAQNSTVLTAQGTAPDGTNTAFKIQENTSTISHSIREPSNSTWSGAATLSCYVKPAGRNFAYMGFTGVSQTSITFDLVNKVSSYKGTNVSSGSVEDAGNGWLRIVAVFSSSITSGRATVGPAESDSSSGLNYTGDGSSGILAWGAQLEAGSFPTSYIPTSGSTVTRSADVASMTGTNFSSWYNQSEGTVLLNATASGLNTLNRLTYITDGSSSNSLGIVETPTATQFLAYTSGVNQASLTYNQIGLSRKAFVYKTNDTAFVANAGTVLTDTSITLPTLNQVDLNSRLGSNPYTGHISRFTYYPFRLTDAQLQALTL